MIQLVIDRYNTYAPFMYLVSSSFLILFCLFLILETPNHANNKNPIHSQSIAESKTYKNYTNAIYFFLMLMYFCFGAFQSALINFIQSFTVIHLGTKPNMARYLISCYYSGQWL